MNKGVISSAIRGYTHVPTITLCGDFGSRDLFYHFVTSISANILVWIMKSVKRIMIMMFMKVYRSYNVCMYFWMVGGRGGDLVEGNEVLPRRVFLLFG